MHRERERAYGRGLLCVDREMKNVCIWKGWGGCVYTKGVECACTGRCVYMEWVECVCMERRMCIYGRVECECTERW